MHIMRSEELALSYRQGAVVMPQDDPSKNIVPARRTSPPPKQAEVSNSPRPNRLKIFHRRTPSSASALSRTCSFYAGPQPTGYDGSPLKSCLKKSSTHHTPSDVSTERTSDSGHKVSFSHVILREYCRQVGDNPSVSSGCPLGIGWKFNKRGKIDIDSYEADRDKDPIPCQRLSAKEREKLLNTIGGVSHTHIIQGQVQAYFDRQLRDETLDQIGGHRNYKSVGPRERLFIMKESAARKLDRAKKGISPTQEQRKLWDDAHEAARRRSLERVQNL